jgi:CelD/BcsL family acetyltransferase involved in cellulose biosynthesis
MVGFDELTADELAAWHRLRAGNPALDSPYFHPGFAAAVHAAGRRVDVAVGRDRAGAVISLLPCHREGPVIRPVGWPGADFQGPILAAGASFDPLTLLVDGVRRFEFDHLLAVPGFDTWVVSRQPSPYLDVTGGMDGYLERASKTGRDNIAQARRRTAKAEREHGPIRFEADVVDAKALARVIDLKRGQYAATGARDYFAEPDRHELMTRLMNTRDPEFAGVLSTLYAGDALLAAHFGIRSGPVLHWWFPVYDPQFSSLAPGWMLLRELILACPELGVDRIDLGRGDDEYKRRAKTGEEFVAQGVVTRSSAVRMLRRSHTSIIGALKASPLGPTLRKVARRLRNR